MTALSEQNGHRPGIITWHQNLVQADVLDKKQLMAYQIASAQYGDSDYFLKDAFADSITFQVGILTEIGWAWRQIVAAEVKRCETAAAQVGLLALHLRKAAGGAGKAENADSERAKAEFFYRVDEPFRKWLLTLDAEQDEEQRVKAQRAWHETLRNIALRLGSELADAAGPAAYRGRTVMESTRKGKDKEAVFYSSPKALGRYRGAISVLMERSDGDAKHE